MTGSNAIAGATDRDAIDLDLMRRLRLGDMDALDALMRGHWAPLVRYAARLIDSTDGAEDIVQDAFVAVWQRRAEWSPTGSPRAYLYRITRNGALKERRRGSVRQKCAGLVRRALRPACTPFDTARQGELRLAFERALATLPPRRREAFVLARYHGLATSEIAAIMDVAPQTVANHLSAAASDLRVLLARFRD